ncbi:MAG: hypothetical protein RL173_278 [Fibrobacterota bacterium]|jgi:hypothetical protein
MSKRHVFLAVLAACASSATANWNLSDYATPTTDPVMTDSIYGIQTYSNNASTVAVTVPGGYVSFVASKIASEPVGTAGGRGYTANVGVLHPLAPDWTEYDLTGLTGVSFEYQNTTKITEVLAVSFGSGAYSKEIADAGTVFEAVLSSGTQLAATTGNVWKKAEISSIDFTTPSWWTAPPDFPSLDSVLKRVKNIQFAPKTLYTDTGSQNGKVCTKCVTPTMTSQTLNIRNVTLMGIEPPGTSTVWNVNPSGIGCLDQTKKFVLDDFVNGSATNTLGGDWFTYSDFDTSGTSTDPAKGASLVSDTIVKGLDPAGSYMQLNAQLRKKSGATYHKYAGWADIGTNFANGASMDATGMTAIGFNIQTMGINLDRVMSIDFKVKTRDVPDTAVHFISLPASAIAAASSAGRFACIRPDMLRQASWVTTPTGFDLGKITQLSWEVKILDNKNATIDTATANFLISEVALYGITEPSVGIYSRRVAPGLAAHYANGGLDLKGFEGIPQVEILALDGRTVASFAPTSRIKLAVPRGTYLLKVKGGAFVAKFTEFSR